MKDIVVEILDESSIASIDIQQSLFDINQQIEQSKSKADQWDYYLSIASGIVCGMLDVIWVGDFDFENVRDKSDSEIQEFVMNVANKFGYKGNDISKAVGFLEKMFPLASDSNEKEFGGGLQHHFRDFSHHPTIIGLVFSLLTQFTELSFGANTNGDFIVVPINDKGKQYIGTTISEKITRGTIIWFFHLVSDIAGSHATVGLSGGTGIPGPILSLAKELSVLTIFKKMSVNEYSLSEMLSKMFNGTLFAQHDKNGKIIEGTEIKLDFRGELGIAETLGKQAIPVIANECIVRSFYFVSRLVEELKEMKSDIANEEISVHWEHVKPFNNPTIDRMITISSCVFSTVDIGEAVITQKYFVSVNYVGIGRFTLALGKEMSNSLKQRNLKQIKKVYEEIEHNTFTKTDSRIFERMEEAMHEDKFGLTIEQVEILYNIEFQKTLNDCNNTNALIQTENVMKLKGKWLNEWKSYMESGFSKFLEDENAVLHWYSKDELIKKIISLDYSDVWYRLVLLEAMLFEPYYTLSFEKDKKGKMIPSKKYQKLSMKLNGYDKKSGDQFLQETFAGSFVEAGYIQRLRETYNKVFNELSEVKKTFLEGMVLSLGATLIVVATVGALAPTIAVALVGSGFTGLTGSALTSACLAYLGGGAVAVGGFGMAGGTVAIVGGSAILGAGIGVGVGGTYSASKLVGKANTIRQSAKLITSMREIFLNDEKDIEYSMTVYEQFVENIRQLEKNLTDLKLKANVATKEEKKELTRQIKNLEESIHVMNVAMKSMNKYNSSFSEGMKAGI